MSVATLNLNSKIDGKVVGRLEWDNMECKKNQVNCFCHFYGGKQMANSNKGRLLSI